MKTVNDLEIKKAKAMADIEVCVTCKYLTIVFLCIVYIPSYYFCLPYKRSICLHNFKNNTIYIATHLYHQFQYNLRELIFAELFFVLITKIGSAKYDFLRKSQISLEKRKNFDKKQVSTVKISSVK